MRRENIQFLVTIWANWLYNFSTRTILAALLPVIEQTVQIGHGGAGSVFSFYSIGYVAALILTGPLIRCFGYTRLVISSHVGIICLVYIFSLGQTYGFLIAVCLLLGFAAGVYLPSGIALLAERFSSKSRAKVMGFHQMAPSVTLLVMPLIVSLLLPVLSWRSVIFLFALMGIPILVALVRYVGGASVSTEAVRPDYFGLFRDGWIWALATLFVVGASCNIGVYSIVPLFLVSEKGFSVESANQLLGISRIGGVCVPFLVGALADRFGFIRTLVPVVLLVGLFTIAMPMGQTEGSLIIFLLLQASLTTGLIPLIFALVTRTIPVANRGTAVAIVTMFGMGVGMGVTPWLLGTMADHYSFSYGISALGVTTLMSVLLLKVFQ